MLLTNPRSNARQRVRLYRPTSRPSLLPALISFRMISPVETAKHYKASFCTTSRAPQAKAHFRRTCRDLKLGGNTSCKRTLANTRRCTQDDRSSHGTAATFKATNHTSKEHVIEFGYHRPSTDVDTNDAGDADRHGFKKEGRLCWSLDLGLPAPHHRL